MTLKTEILAYAADGLRMSSHFYVDDRFSGPRPGVLVFPEAFGLGEHAKSRAERLAGLGFAALACDLHGDGRIIPSLDEVMGVIDPMIEDPNRTRARAKGGLDAILARPEADNGRIAAIGYCFGGTMALELARSGADIAAAVGFHSGLATADPQGAKNIKGRILVCIGADDPVIPVGQRVTFEQEMRLAGIDWQMNLFGGVVHSFTDPDARNLGRPELARYDAGADERSWSAMMGLFGELFG